MHVFIANMTNTTTVRHEKMSEMNTTASRQITTTEPGSIIGTPHKTPKVTETRNVTTSTNKKALTQSRSPPTFPSLIPMVTMGLQHVGFYYLCSSFKLLAEI